MKAAAATIAAAAGNRLSGSRLQRRRRCRQVTRNTAPRPEDVHTFGQQPVDDRRTDARGCRCME